MPSQHTREEAANRKAILVPLDLDELQIVSQEWLANGTIRVEVIATRTQARCPHCQNICVKIHDTRPRKKRDIALRGHQVELIVLKRRFQCLHCRKSGTRTRYSVWLEKEDNCAFARSDRQAGLHAADCACSHDRWSRATRMSQECFQSVALQELKRKGRSLDEHQPLSTPQFLGIDEFARRKGHWYDPILGDLQAHQVLEVSAGRKQEEVVTLLQRLNDPDAVKAVSMDRSASYRPAVQLCLPKAQIIVDHLHVIQHVMKGFKKVLQSWAHKKEGKPLLEGKQSLFLRAKEELTEEQAQERSRIGEQLPVLEMAWLLKDELRTWYATATMATAAKDLDAWIAKVQQQGPDPLRKTLSAFKNWRHEILAFFQFLPTRLSNGFVEGKKNRTKALMRQGYGYRNRHHLRLRILVGDVA